MFEVLVSILVTFSTPTGLASRRVDAVLPAQMYGFGCRSANWQYRAELGAKEGYGFEWSECTENLRRK